jgi:DNA-binding transcriptional regulator/RsmH inhibitor MraZ
MKIQLDKRSRMTVSPGFRQISASLWETLSLYNCSILHRVQSNLRKASKNIEKMGSVAPQLNETFGRNVRNVSATKHIGDKTSRQRKCIGTKHIRIECISG